LAVYSFGIHSYYGCRRQFSLGNQRKHHGLSSVIGPERFPLLLSGRYLLALGNNDRVSLLGGIVNYLLNKKTDKLRLVKVLTGSAVSLLSWGLFTPLIPGLFIWSILVGLPLVFSYRNIPKAFYLQLIFKFIFSTGWIIIGNILY
jgi:hypothetical protein